MSFTTLASGSTWGTYRAALNAMLAELFGGALNINAQTGTTYTLALTDAGKQVDISNALANTVTVPTTATAAIPVGTIISVCQTGAGATTIAFATGVTSQVPSNVSLTISTRYQKAYLEKVASDTWRAYVG